MVLTALVIHDLTRRTGHFNLAQGVVGTASGIGAALSTAVFGFVTVSFGQMAVFLSIASVAVIGALILWLLMPETKLALTVARGIRRRWRRWIDMGGLRGRP